MTTEDPLREEHNALRREAARQRAAFARSEAGPFAMAMLDAYGEYARMRAEGVSREDACKGLEAVWRAHWPKPVTKFPTCPDCDSTGYRVMACWHEQRCQRPTCGAKHPAWEHPYVVPCECPSGDRLRRREVQPEDELAAVGKVSKPKRRGFTRFGA